MYLQKYLLVLITLLILGFAADATVFNVKQFGAVGNGIADDSKAIKMAQEALIKAKSGTLFFPKGKYLYKKRGSALVFKGLSNLTVKFEPGAVIIMNNLVMQKGKRPGLIGTGHGLVFQYPGKNITLENVFIEWQPKAENRSYGDGIRFEGYPDEKKTISNITMINCRTVGCPQAGAIFMGCSDITVKNFRPENNKADGLHFNACRRVKVDGLRGINTGDDTLAFVTYYHPTRLGAYSGVRPPFNQPSLGEWNNTDSTASNIYSEGGGADGMRIAGGKNISVSNITVVKKRFAGIQVDCANQTRKNRAVGWSYMASRGIKISNATVRDCPFGYLTRTLNLKMDDPEDRWLPEIKISNLTVSNCKYGVDLLDTANVSIDGIKSDSRILLMNARGKLSLSNVELTGANLYVHFVQGKNFQGWKGNRELLPSLAKTDLSNLIDKNVRLNNIKITGGMLRISDFAGLIADKVEIINPPKYAIGLYKSINCTLNDVKIESKNTALHISNVRNIKLSNWVYGPQKRLMTPTEKQRKDMTITLDNVKYKKVIKRN
jgi:Pectate lyase superfamily protein